MCHFNMGNFLKSLGPIDRKFHGHGKNDRFVLYEILSNNAVLLQKYKHQRYEKKIKENNMSTINRKNRKYVRFMGNT